LIEEKIVKKGPLTSKVKEFVYPPIENKKAERTEAVHTSTVTISNGKIFDADEAAQTRMHRALKVAEITGESTTKWKLADNTFSDVTVEELEEAFVLAAKNQADLWLQFG